MPYSSGRVVHDADAHIMETPTWLRDHADPAVRDRIEPLRYPGGNELRQTGDPEEQQRDLDGGVRPAAPSKHALRRVPGRRGRGDHAPQELRRDRFVPRRGPAARARPARLLEPARVQHLPQPAAPRLGARRRPRPRLRRRPRPQPRHGRVLRGRPAAAADRATCRSSTSTAPRAMADEAIAIGAAALLVASGCPPGHSPSHLGLDPVWARAQEAGIPIVFHVGGTGDLIDPTYFRNGLPDPARLPRRRGELPLGRLHGHPRSARADARHHDLRRRARALPRAAHRRDRAGRDLGAVVDAPDGVGVRGVRAARGAAAGAVAAAERVRAPPDARSRRTPPRTSAGSSSRPAPRCACSRRTTRTSRAAGARSSASRRRSATRPTRSADASTATTSSTSWVARPRPSPPDRHGRAQALTSSPGSESLTSGTAVPRASAMRPMVASSRLA